MRNLLILIIFPLLASCASEIDNDLNKALDDNNIFVGDPKDIDELIDVEAPSGTIIINSGAQFTKYRDVKLDISATDSTGVTGYYLSANGKAPSSIFTDGWVNIKKTADYSATISAILSSMDGVESITIWYKDMAGNISDAFDDSITYDGTPPTGSIEINHGDKFTTSLAVNLALSASDSIGVTDYYISEMTTRPTASSNWTTISSSVNHTFSGTDGIKTIYVWYRDAAGNISNMLSDRIIYDNTLPTGSIIINNGDDFTTVLPVTLTLSASDSSGVTGYFISNDTTSPIISSSWEAINKTVNYSDNISSSLLTGPIGVRTIYVWFKDVAGNISNRYDDSITYDSTSLSGSIAINNGDNFTNSRDVTLKLTATGKVTGYHLSESNATPNTSSNWTTVTSTNSYSNSNVPFTLSAGDGEKTVYVWYKNGAGVVSSRYEDSITYDGTPPSGSITINEGDNFTKSNNVILILSATDSNKVDAYYVSETNAIPSQTNWIPVARMTSYSKDNIAFTLSAGNGVKTVYVWYKDVAGNVTSALSSQITLFTGTFTVTYTDKVTNEDGGSITLSIKPDSQPPADITIGLSSTNKDEGRVPPTRLTFTESYWDAQTVTVTGVDDSSSDLAQSYEIQFSPSISTAISLYNLDNEYKLPDTGQDTGYTPVFGEDHDYDINPPSYTDNNNTITDNNTGLMWEKHGVIRDNWNAAKNHCSSSSVGTHNNWRLPTVDELADIVDYSRYPPPAINQIFTGTNLPIYWTSTDYISDNSKAWYVNFSDGGVNYGDATTDHYVRCVRP